MRQVIVLFVAAFVSPGLIGAENVSAGEFLRLSGIKAGLAVHVNCPDAARAMNLARGGKFLVHALSRRTEIVTKMRRAIQAQELYGQISVEQNPLRRLPYADNLVNLLIAEDLPKLLEGGLTIREILRVVCPNGFAFLGQRGGSEEELKGLLTEAGIKTLEIINKGGLWAKVRKPRPAEMDDWPQYMHGSDRNAVSHDLLAGPPVSLRWLAGTEWPKGPGHASGNCAVVSANGRNFYLTANTVANLSAPGEKMQYYLVARDAYNGLFLWERPWEDPAVLKTANTTYMKNVYRMEPLPLAASGDRVFAGGLQVNKVVTCDAATGRLLGSIDLGSPVREIAVHNGRIVARSQKQVRLIDPDENAVLWNQDVQAGNIVVGDGGVFFLAAEKGASHLARLEMADGQEKWRVSVEGKPWDAPVSKGQRPGPLILRTCQDGVLALTDGANRTHAVSCRDGKHLWVSTPRRAFAGRTPPFFMENLLWLPRYKDPKKGRRASARGGAVWEGLSPLTGEAKKGVNGPGGVGGCGSFIATDRYLLFPRNISLLDLKTQELYSWNGARGPCNLHMFPANGLWYNLPQACRCITPAVRGYLALSSKKRIWSAGGVEVEGESERLVKGTAYGKIPPPAPAPGSDWPTLRHDPARSGSTSSPVPADLKLLWEARLAEPPYGPLKEDLLLNQAYGDPLSSPVISGGRIFLALPNSHQVVALDAKDGSRRWAFTAGGMVDSPPTIAGDRCLFGTRTGWLYCLRAGDGQLAWRFRVAPLERRIVAFGQLESPWRTSGSVLVLDKSVFCSAGRSPKADGGGLVCEVDIQSGRLLWEKRESTFWGIIKPVLVSDGGLVFMGIVNYDAKSKKRGKGNPPHRLAGGKVAGLLSGHWRRMPSSMHCAQYAWSHAGAGGHLLVFNDKNVLGYREIGLRGKRKVNKGWARMPACELFCRAKILSSAKSSPQWKWTVPEPAQVEALLLAGETLFAAGTPDKDTRQGGFLWAFSTGKGEKLTEKRLDVPPVFDGMAAANGRLYISTQDGKLLCFGKK